jgi:short-subunit dehydrogenase
MNRVLVFGATSAIVEATARRFAAEGDALFLVGRSEKRLKSIAEDLQLRGAANVAIAVLEATDFDRHEETVTGAASVLGGIDLALIGYGTLPDQKLAETDPDLVRRCLEVNATSTLCLMTHLAKYFEKTGAGTIAVISSVAGDRGRASNYLYGSGKAAVSHYAQGLRCRLAPLGIRVVTIKPGFVDTPMTAQFRKGFLWATPDAVAKSVHSAIVSGRDIAYVPWFWRWIMLVIRLIPESIFKRLPL